MREVLQEGRIPRQGRSLLLEVDPVPLRLDRCPQLLDSLSLLGFYSGGQDIDRGLDWLRGDQGKDGLWPSRHGGKDRWERDLWVSLAASWVIRRVLYGDTTSFF